MPGSSRILPGAITTSAVSSTRVEKRPQAIASYSAALRCDKGYALAYLNRGLALLDLKQFQVALDDFEQAAALGRDDALLHLGCGTVLENLNQSSQADAAFALALDS